MIELVDVLLFWLTDTTTKNGTGSAAKGLSDTPERSLNGCLRSLERSTSDTMSALMTEVRNAEKEHRKVKDKKRIEFSS